MFNDSSIMVLVNDGKSIDVRILEVDRNTQNDICENFANAATSFQNEMQVIPFDGNYKPNDDELLSIQSFSLPENITDAIRNPLSRITALS